MNRFDPMFSEAIGLDYALNRLSPKSAYGQGLLRSLAPFSREREDALWQELESVELIHACLTPCAAEIERLEHTISRFLDILRTVSDASVRPLSEVELFELKNQIFCFIELKEAFDRLNTSLQLKDIAFFDLREAFSLLDPDGSGSPAFYLSERYSETLSKIRDLKRENDAKLLHVSEDALDALKRERTKIVALEREEEAKVLEALTLRLRPYLEPLTQNIHALALLDLRLQKAKHAQRYGGVMPRRSGAQYALKGGVHLKTKDVVEKRGRAFKALSVTLDPGAAVLTGANMGGKSVALKTLLQNAALFMLGIFPLADDAQIPLFDDVCFLGGDGSDDDRGLSSFGGEILRLNQTLARMKGKRCFLAVDEFARGTNPEEGAALAAALTAHLNELPSISILSTHFDRVSPFGNRHLRVIGLSHADMQEMALRMSTSKSKQQVIYDFIDYGIVEAGKKDPVPKDALTISRLLSLEEDVIRRAELTLLTKDL